MHPFEHLFLLLEELPTDEWCLAPTLSYCIFTVFIICAVLMIYVSYFVVKKFLWYLEFHIFALVMTVILIFFVITIPLIPNSTFCYLFHQLITSFDFYLFPMQRSIYSAFPFFHLIHPIILIFIYYFLFLATPLACGSSWARD